jgi:hypothetical protein
MTSDRELQAQYRARMRAYQMRPGGIDRMMRERKRKAKRRLERESARLVSRGESALEAPWLDR